MTIRHSTPADSSFSPAGKAAWEAGHTGDASDLSFTPSGTPSASTTVALQLQKSEYFDSITSLKGWSGSITNRTLAHVLGDAAAFDGGGGMYRWDSTSSATGNDKTIVTPTAGGTGRWIKLDAAKVNNKWLGHVQRNPFFRKVALAGSVNFATVTTGTATSFAGSVFISWNSNRSSAPTADVPNDRFTFARGFMTQDGTTRASAGWGPNNVTVAAAGPTYGGTSGSISFVHDGTQFELVFGANSTNYLIKIDDELVTTTPQSVGGAGTFYAKYAFASARKRRVDVIAYNTSFNGVNIGYQDSIEPAPTRGPRCIIIGDSWCANGLSWGAWFADAMGWDDVWNSGVASTGLLNDNGGVATTYRTRVTHDVTQWNPDVVIIAGSQNDFAFTGSAIGTELSALITALKAALPQALIVVMPPIFAGFGHASWTTQALSGKSNMKSITQAAGLMWIDPAEIPMEGTALSSTITQAIASGVAYFRTDTRCSAGDVVSLNNDAERVEIVYSRQTSPGVQDHFINGVLKLNTTLGMTWTQVGRNILSGRGYQTSESMQTADTTNTSADIAVPSSAKFVVGMAVFVDTTAAGFTAGTPYWVKTITDATHIQVSASIAGSFAPGAAVTATATLTGPFKIGQPSYSDVALDSTQHPAVSGASPGCVSIGLYVAEQFIKYSQTMTSWR